MSTSFDYRLPCNIPDAVVSAKRKLHDLDELFFPVNVSFQSYSTVNSRAFGASAKTKPTVVHSKANVDDNVTSMGEAIWNSILNRLELNPNDAEQAVDIKALSLHVTCRYVNFIIGIPCF
jgi:hypothetical protein